jgi:MFS family permease
MKTKRDDSANSRVRSTALIIAACLFSDSMLYIVLPIYWQQYGLDSIWQVGILLAANRLIRIPLHPWIGAFYQKSTIRTGMIIGVVLTVITSLAFAMLSGFLLLLLTRIIWGIAWALLSQAGQLTVVEATQQNSGNAGHLTGTFHSYMRTGSLIGMVCGGFLIEGLGRMWIGVSFAGIALLMLPLIFRLMKGAQVTVTPPLQNASANPLASLPSSQFIPIFLTGFIVTFIINGMFTSTISYWVAQQEISSLVLVGGLGAAALAGLLVSLRWLWDPLIAPWVGAHTDRTGHRLQWLIATSFICGFCFFLLPATLPIYAWIANLLLLLVAITILFTLQEAWFIEKTATHAAHRHKLISAYSVWSDFGSALGPIVAYLLLTYSVEFHVILVVLVLLVISSLIWGANIRTTPTISKHA